ncbi:Uncharacterized protein SVXHr_0411 [Halorhabdus sp. SVX81]|nr:Uncharacterized protein SVXHr_0411 [Halorhabdus sp. SVX81]
MGNYLRVPALFSSVMATERQAVGIAHYTVVPENFKPADSTPKPAERSADRGD